MNAAARLAALEQGFGRLTARRAPKVSEILSEGRARLPFEPPIHDIAELEREALLPGLRGQMAAGWLRVLRWPGSGSLLPQDAVGSGDPAPSEPTRSTAPAAVDRDLLLQRIDATLARANGHV